ncbi:TetR/AcrR family transcriptional regulator [Hyphomicrobium sp.]|uniref:TetR/AcrR family transcriptional regulator n=1 Tax=Hyphomicrobium sp. TaxID=82 RepID=UPI000F9C6842|nr:TetR/AcrR family transcriptional regulator [Hyphomicrobium sp.]RUP00510.1 MAG: TetR/AcrR family transcriptional regulator [Hyphomicrobium sp.]
MEGSQFTGSGPKDERRGGRPAAGTDPAKRRQILDGAGRIFSELGFDATSMSDVARAAQVSKATLYVYFQDKEHLFTAICAEHRDRHIAEKIALLDVDQPLEDVLYRFGIEMLETMAAPFVIAAHRIVISVAERMPEIGSEFYEAGPVRVINAVAKYLDHHVAAGRLNIPDTRLAAAQLCEVIQGGLCKARLYGVIAGAPPREDIEKNVSSGLAMFLKGYAA